MSWNLWDLRSAVDDMDGMYENYRGLLTEFVIAAEECLDQSSSGGDSGDLSCDFKHYVEDNVKKIREYLDEMSNHQSLIESEIKTSEELVKMGVDKWISSREVSELMEEHGY